jgi:hypothetical protein
MAAYNKIQDFVEQLGLAKHNLNTDTIKVMLTNSAPIATNTVKADLTDLGTANGYTAGGADTQNTYSETTGTGTVAVVDVVWTAAGGSIGPFRYVAAYNDTQTSPADPLICWWDYGSALTLLDTESFTVDFGANTLFSIS